MKVRILMTAAILLLSACADGPLIVKVKPADSCGRPPRIEVKGREQPRLEEEDRSREAEQEEAFRRWYLAEYNRFKLELEQELATWRGSQESRLLFSWGQPSDVLPLADGGRVLNYIRSSCGPGVLDCLRPVWVPVSVMIRPDGVIDGWSIK